MAMGKNNNPLTGLRLQNGDVNEIGNGLQNCEDNRNGINLE
jgi:hypothetical protein